MTDEIYQVLFYASSLMEAEFIKGLLEGEGIAARIPGELAADPFTTARETSGDVKVEVPSDTIEASRAIITKARDEGRELQGWLATHPDAAPTPSPPDPATE